MSGISELKSSSGSIQIRKLKLPWQKSDTLRISIGKKRMTRTATRESGLTVIVFDSALEVTNASPLKIVG